MSPASTTLPDLTGAFVDEGYLQLVELLGCGGYAKVYKALDATSSSNDPAYYAVKCIRNGAPGSRDVSILQNEFRMHRDVSHEPGVVSFHHVFTGGEDGEFVFMVLDLAAGDMLHSIVKRPLYVDRPALITEAFMQVLAAVEQCHENGVLHRDLKPQNFLCDSAGTGIRLADFGMATREDESQIFKCGTPAFMSPGSFPSCADSTPPNRVSYSPRESDLWALGVILFSLVTSTLPWAVADLSDPKYVAFRTDEDNYLVSMFHLTVAANDLFRWCFAADAVYRPTLAHLRAAVLNIERFSLAEMLPCAPAAALPPPAAEYVPKLSELFSSRLFTPALLSGLPKPAGPSSSSASSAGPGTPSLFTGSAPPSTAIADLLDAANAGLAMLPPPLVPPKLHTYRSAPSSSAGSIVFVLPPPVKMARPSTASSTARSAISRCASASRTSSATYIEAAGVLSDGGA
ncbi:kinase-like domain-containing protein [Mycena vulgaris]|nr:kinase-like domain-containing protein [Mycena vulgaris]